MSVTFHLLCEAPVWADGVKQGDRLVAECTLSILAQYEWDAFELPEVRQDWRVAAVQPAADYGTHWLDLLPVVGPRKAPVG